MWTKLVTHKIPLDEARGGLADGHGIRRSKPLYACSNVGRFAQSQLFLSPASTHLAYHDQPGMNLQAYRQMDAFVLLQADIQCPPGYSLATIPLSWLTIYPI